jgi:hypothetical protein
VLHPVGVDAVRVVALRVAYPDRAPVPLDRRQLDHLALVDVVEAEGRPHVRQAHREAGVLHLPGERLLERARHLVATVEVDDVPAHERRREEREALDVVPVDVAEEDPRLEGHRRQQRVSEKPEAGPAVEDEDPATRAHLDAARVSADLDRRWTGGGDAAADPPEPHLNHRPATLQVRDDIPFSAVPARLLDALAIVMLLGAGGAFFAGARAITTREDLHALYWMAVGVALVRGTSGLARADRSSG